MELSIQPLTRDFKELASFYRKVREKFRTDFDEDIGTLYDDFLTEFSLDSVFSDPNLVLEARLGEKLIGTLGAEIISCKFRNEPLKGAVLGYLALDSDYWDKRDDILDPLITELFSRITEREVDFIYCMPIVSKNEPEIDFLKEKLRMVVLNKNVESKIKLIGKEGVDMLKEARNLNVVEAQAARIVARLKSDDISSGKIRKVKPEDYPNIIKLLNTHSKRLDLARVWTIDEFERLVKIKSRLKKRKYHSREKFKDTPFGYHMWTWEDNGQLKGFAACEISEILMVNGYVPMAFLMELAFSEDVESSPNGIDEMKGFLSHIIRSLHKTVCLVNAPLPQYALKVFGKAGFMGEQRTTRLLMKSLSIKGNKILESKKLKNFYLMFVDFSV
ncbi:MAG: hypothetical protein ACXQS8_08225 [Candidatus Helarchaeales archaeon]